MLQAELVDPAGQAGVREAGLLDQGGQLEVLGAGRLVPFGGRPLRDVPLGDGPGGRGLVGRVPVRAGRVPVRSGRVPVRTGPVEGVPVGRGLLGQPQFVGGRGVGGVRKGPADRTPMLVERVERSVRRAVGCRPLGHSQSTPLGRRTGSTSGSAACGDAPCRESA